MDRIKASKLICEKQTEIREVRQQIAKAIDNSQLKNWWPSAPSTVDCLRARLCQLNTEVCDIALMAI